ncbi:PREDICTED: trypsin-1-like [Polistes canadensis]|uniref:trypsin-1-like n=1 Tax=Polistes canadensis TaxID=91411 RepID=UPI000718B1D1|nr:PREDICTED: trypsin-1-like [Polistes canadensis]
MYVKILFVVILLGVFVRASDNETRSNDRFNFTTKDTNITDDKGFFDWLYALIGRPIPTATPIPEIIESQKCLSSCVCGLTNTQNRIVGGVETKVNQYPWMALLKYKKRFYCGGSVINSRYVLTAAHCVDRFDPSLMSVVILEHDRNSTTETQIQEYKVEQVIKHSGYSFVNFNNDIALIKLNRVITFEGLMRPVCLPDKGKTYSDSIGIVTGWGAVEESGSVSNTLQEVMVPIISNSVCRSLNYPSKRITDNMICAGYAQGNKDSCQGDSGGPLHVLNDTVHQIVGIVSWGEGCAKPKYPGVYTRVNRYLTWIQRNTLDGCYC